MNNIAIADAIGAMSGILRATDNDLIIADNTRRFLCAVRFTANRKRNMKLVLAAAARASVFVADEAERIYLAAFDRTYEQAELASYVLTEMSVAGWKRVTFIGGRVVDNHHSALRIIHCYSKCGRVKDYRAHCHEIVEREVGTANNDSEIEFSLIDQPAQETLTLRIPCKQIHQFVRISEHDRAEPIERVRAVAAERFADACPMFRIEDFEIIKHVAPAKRFW